MFIDVVPNGRSASAVLLRESYREGSRVRKRTLANLSKLPASVVDGLRVLLQGGTAIARPEEVFEIRRSLPHGHVAAVIGMMRKLDLPRLLSRTVSRERDLALALIASRIIAPGSKLATARALSPETASSSLGRVLDLGVIEEREIYAALDWLGEQQDRIERSLRADTSRTARWCCMTSRPPMSRAAAVSLPGTAIAVTVGRIGCRSSTAYSVIVTAGRSRSRCSRAMSGTRARCPRRSTN
jgi:hypothetical protein